MQQARAEKHVGRATLRFVTLLVALGAAIVALLWLKGSVEGATPSLPARVQDFVTLALSIVVEALPFVVLGALVSAVIRVAGPTERLLRRLPRQPALRRLFVSLFGTFMPVCECGNVPVARGLMVRGLTVAESTTFLLAAPILNPVTLLATASAFRFIDPSVVWVRMAGALLVANLIGALISLHKDQSTFLSKGFYETVCAAQDDHRDHSAWREGIAVFRDEASLMLGVLCLGALIAATTQVFVPRGVLATVGGDPVLSILAMVLLAFVVSICANVDAFFALAYAGTFTAGSIVAFLIFGPMVDIKMLAMMRTTYTTRLLVLVTAVAALSSVLIGLLVNYAL